MQRHIAICVAFGLMFYFVAFVLSALFGFWIAHDTGLGSSSCTRGGAARIYQNLMITLIAGGGLLFFITFAFQRVARASFIIAYLPFFLAILTLVHSAISYDGWCFSNAVGSRNQDVDFSDWAGRYAEIFPLSRGWSLLIATGTALLCAVFVALRGPGESREG